MGRLASSAHRKTIASAVAVVVLHVVVTANVAVTAPDYEKRSRLAITRTAWEQELGSQKLGAFLVR